MQHNEESNDKLKQVIEESNENKAIAKTLFGLDKHLLYWNRSNKEKLAFFIEHFDEVNFQDGTTREHIRAAQGDLEFFRKHPAGINALLTPNDYGFTPFYFLALALKDVPKQERKNFLDDFTKNSPIKINEAIWRQPQKSTLPSQTLFSCSLQAIEDLCMESLEFCVKFSQRSWLHNYPMAMEIYIDAIVHKHIHQNEPIKFTDICTRLVTYGYLLNSTVNTAKLVTEIYQQVLRKVGGIIESTSEEYFKIIDNIHRYFAQCYYFISFFKDSNLVTPEGSIERLEQAIGCFGQIRNVHPSYMEGLELCKELLISMLFNSADSYYDRENWLDASELYIRAIKIRAEICQTPQQIENHDILLNNLTMTFYRLGEDFYKAKNYPEATKAYEQALTTDNQRSPVLDQTEERKKIRDDVLVGLLQAHSRQVDEFVINKQWVEAINRVNVEITLNEQRQPSDNKLNTLEKLKEVLAATYHALGKDLHQAGKWQAAIEAIEQALAIYITREHAQQQKSDLDVMYRLLASTHVQYRNELRSMLLLNQLSTHLQAAVAALGNICTKIPEDYQNLANLFDAMPGKIAVFGSRVFRNNGIHLGNTLHKFEKTWLTMIEDKRHIRQMLFILEIIINDYNTPNFPNNSFRVALLGDPKKVEHLKELAAAAKQLLDKEESLPGRIFKDPQFFLTLSQRVCATENKVQYLETTGKRSAPLTDRSSPLHDGSLQSTNELQDKEDVIHEVSSKHFRTDLK